MNVAKITTMQAASKERAARRLAEPPTPDERHALRRHGGERYGLKNSSGEYIAGCNHAPTYMLPGGPRVTRDVRHAARWTDTAPIDDIMIALRARDPSWRVVRLLDFRWN